MERSLEKLQLWLDGKYVLPPVFKDSLQTVINGVKGLQYRNERLENENESLCDKLADIRKLFDESDMKAEGHGMEDAIGSPYAVVCYAENKLKRLIKDNQELQEELNKWLQEFNF